MPTVKSVTILFKAAARQEIKEACAVRGLELSPDFDTQGQCFNEVLQYSNSDGTVDIVVPSRENEAVAYSYPLADVARVKAVFERN